MLPYNVELNCLYISTTWGHLRPVNVARKQEEFPAFRDAIIYLQAQGGSCDKETLIKKENTKLSSYIRSSCKIIYDQRPPHIWGNICVCPHILGSPSSYMTLQLLHSEFLYIWGKFDFLFYQWKGQRNGQCNWPNVIDLFILWVPGRFSRVVLGGEETEWNWGWSPPLTCQPKPHPL